MSDTNNTNRASSVLRFFSHPSVGITGSIASVIGIALSVYLFQASREKPELKCFVHPAKAAVVRTSESSGLSVLFDGKEVKGNVTAAQIAFWNAGKKSIRSNAVLSPLVIRTSNGERILEARVRRTSRDVAAITLDSTQLASGKVKVQWNILEQNDGGILQLVYAGDETVKIQADAIVEGQPEISQLNYTKELLSPGEQYSSQLNWFNYLPSYIMIGEGLLFLIAFMISSLITRLRHGERSYRRYATSLVILVLSLGMISYGIMSYLAVPTGPPFGF